MQLAPKPSPLTYPAPLPMLAVSPPLDLARDALDLSKPGRFLPRAVSEGALVTVDTTAPDFAGQEVYLALDQMGETPWMMRREGFTAALAGAQQLAANGSPIAVVQLASTGVRYLVPVGVWSEVDESQMGFDSVGGEPYWKGESDHVMLRTDPEAAVRGADVEAVVFDHGRRWVNLTGHPVRLPGAAAS